MWHWGLPRVTRRGRSQPSVGWLGLGLGSAYKAVEKGQGLSAPRATIGRVSDEIWRPLGVETEADVAEYDALHDGVPPWMLDAYWAWVRNTLTIVRRYADGSGSVPMLRTSIAEEMCQTLRIRLPNLRVTRIDLGEGKRQLNGAISALLDHRPALQVADYLLAHAEHANRDVLDGLLTRSKSAWTVGTRHGRPGLVRRVPLGVQVAADSVMARAGRAGVRLAKAWEELYGLTPDPSAAYRLAIQAVEDAAVPVVSPDNTAATLGSVLGDIRNQGDWRLLMDREHDHAPSGEVLLGMMRMLWHGQHDRHGGQPSAPGNVSVAEATVAVSLAVTLVNWFSAGTVARGAKPSS